ncbi:hypothetical protein SRHO_G00036140 [Serrasalmus rhombeus]
MKDPTHPAHTLCPALVRDKDTAMMEELTTKNTKTASASKLQLHIFLMLTMDGTTCYVPSLETLAEVTCYLNFEKKRRRSEPSQPYKNKGWNRERECLEHCVPLSRCLSALCYGP